MRKTHMPVPGTNQRVIRLPSNQVIVELKSKLNTRYNLLAVAHTQDDRQFYVGGIAAEEVDTVNEYCGVHYLGKRIGGSEVFVISPGGDIDGVGLFACSTSDANTTFARDRVEAKFTDVVGGSNRTFHPSTQIGGVHTWLMAVLVGRELRPVDTGSAPGSRRRPVLEPDGNRELRLLPDRGPENRI
jgi:hypothetical protein